MLVATCGMYAITCLSRACYVCHSADFETDRQTELVNYQKTVYFYT